MEKYTKSKTLKKIALILLVIMIFNFIVPNMSKATDDEGSGGILFTPIADFLETVSDLVLGFVQDIFVEDRDLLKTTSSDRSYLNLVRNSTSFSDLVNDLMASEYVNEWNTTGDDENPIYERYSRSNVEHHVKGWLKKSVGINKTIKKWKKFPAEDWAKIINGSESTSAVSDDIITELFTKTYPATVWKPVLSLGGEVETGYVIQYGPGMIFSGVIGEFDINFINPENPNDENSSAVILRSTVSRWYQDIQKVALIGLLSVLVYVAIRMIISSTGKDKAKYKKMLMDWLVAICIIFIIHYIMLFILNITSAITDVFRANAIEVNSNGIEYDSLMSDIRNKIDGAETRVEMFAELIMYIALIIFTVMFTIQYLKRVIYMAFLTMIAPLIALTYPLDKIKDSKAQAFSMWLREYIFNALIQPVHLLLYVVLVSSASELVKIYPLYGVVALGFLVPAEKFFRSMFGFDKTSSVGTLGAVAGGAAVMNMLNKIKSPSKGKSSGGGEEKSNTTRTRTHSPLAGLQNENGSGSKGQETNAVGEKLAGTNAIVADANGEIPREQLRNAIKEKQNVSGEAENSSDANKKAEPNRGKGVKKVISGAVKSGVKKTIRFTGKTAGRLAFGTIGLAAGVTSGDFEKALGYGAGGAVAGGAIGGRLVDGAINAPKNIEKAGYGLIDTYREGAYDRETAQNMRFDREFLQSESGKELSKKYSEDQVRQCLEAGITEPSEMEKILGYSDSNAGISVSEAISYNHLAQNCPDSILNGKPSDLRRYLNLRGIAVDDNRADEIQKIMNKLK